MAEYWWSIEVLDAELPANRWRDAYAAALIEAAISHGAKDWDWNKFDWGVVFEVAFEDWDAWIAYRQLPAVVAALDAVPDPINGLMIYPGRGGSSGDRLPRKPGRVRPAVPRRSRTSPDPERVLNVRRHRDLAIEDGLASWREEERRIGRTMVPAWHPEASSAA